MILNPIVTAINTTTYELITVSTSEARRDISLHTEDDSAFIIATSSAGANAATIPAGKSLSFKNIVAGELLYAKAVGGTPNLVLLTGLTVTW